MKDHQSYTLKEIEEKLYRNALPFSGITKLGSTKFYFLAPCFYAGVALHAGHQVRPELKESIEINTEDRYREEDPYTNRFIKHFPIQIIGCDSRFEYDLNRDQISAIYDVFKKEWGLKVWKKELSATEKKISLAKHQEFHNFMDIVTNYLLKQNDFALIFDMHSYCYQREKEIDWFKDDKPELNIGTKAVNRTIFGSAIDRFKRKLSGTYIENHPIRVKENDVFEGGYLARRLSKEHQNQLLVLALEYKKMFMNERLGTLFVDVLDKLIIDFTAAVEDLLKYHLFTKKK
jgi:hypothetical protein